MTDCERFCHELEKLENLVLAGQDVNLWGHAYVPLERVEDRVRRLNEVIEAGERRERVLKSRIGLLERDIRTLEDDDDD